MGSLFLSIGIPIAVILFIVLFLVFLLKVCYKKCPPNKAMVITGPRGSRTVIGRASFVIPVIQRVDYMSLENIQVDFTSKQEIQTKDAINISVDAVANMSIDQDPNILKIASSKFLGYSIRDIEAIVRPILEGNIREIISQTYLKDLIQGNKKEFATRVVENVEPNLRDMGLKLTTFNIQNFADQNGIIANLGIENTAQIKKDAQIAAAQAQAEVEIKSAEARQKANEAKVAADTEIAIKQNELNIKKAELKKAADIKNAQAEAASKIEYENQRKEQEVAEVDANLARQEREIELKEKDVQVTEKTLEAQIKKKAEAKKYAAQQDADAELYTKQRRVEGEKYDRQLAAEAEKYEAEQAAEARKAAANADRYEKEQAAEAIKAAGLAEAEAIRARGEANAAATRAQAEAEAEGLLKKAEAMKQYGEAATQQMQLDALKVYFEQLPKIAEAVGNGYQNVESIKMYGGDSSQLTGNMINTITQISDGLNESIGIDLKSVLAGFLGGRLANNGKEVAVNISEN